MYLKTILLLFVISLINCGGGGGDNNSVPTPRPSSVIAGTAFDGLILNGTVNIYAFDGGVQGELLGSGATDSTGLYSISIVSADRPILIEVKDGRYIEEASGNNVVLDSSSNDRLTGVAYYVSGQPITMSLTYYTHLATGLAEYLVSVGSNTRTAIETANTRMSSMIGIDITNTTPLDVSLVSNATSQPTSGHLYGMATAAVSQYTMFVSVSNNSAVHLLYNSISFARMAYNDLRFDGLLNGQGASGLLSLGLVAVTPETYRHIMATNIFVMASSAQNRTGLTSADVLNTAVTLNNVNDAIFGGATPVPLGDTLPIISNLSITEGQTVWQTVNITADVTDIAGIASVELRIDDVSQYTFAAGEAVVFAFDTTAYSDGVHQVSLIATNVFGGILRVDINLTIYNGQTVISNVTPPTGSAISGQFTMTAGVGDPLGLSQVMFLIDSVPFLIAADPTSPSALITSSNYVDGSHVVDLQATNNAGFVTTESVNYVFDNTDPLTAITNVISGDILSGNKSIIFTASDNLLLDRVELRLDSVLLATYTSFGALSYAMDTTIYAEGVHTLSVLAFDKAGNNTVSNYNITIDQSSPTVNIINPLDGDIISGGFTIRANVTDSNGIATVEVLLNGEHLSWANSPVELTVDSSFVCTANYNPDGTVGSGIANCYSNGPVTITVVATDTAGKVTQSSVDVVFDNTAPVLSLNVTSCTTVNRDGSGTISFSVAINATDPETSIIGHAASCTAGPGLCGLVGSISVASSGDIGGVSATASVGGLETRTLNYSATNAAGFTQTVTRTIRLNPLTATSASCTFV